MLHNYQIEWRMKMNMLKFAAFVSYLTAKCGNTFDAYELETVEHYIKQFTEAKATEAEVNELLKEMNNPTGIIPAIKAYRVLTGAGLKEAKDAVEKYRIAKPNV